MRWTWAVTLLLAIWVAPRAVLTSGPPETQTFDAASVKESSTLELDEFFRTTPGRFTVTNLSVRWILRYAFRLREYQVVGAPDWTERRARARTSNRSVILVNQIFDIMRPWPSTRLTSFGNAASR